MNGKKKQTKVKQRKIKAWALIHPETPNKIEDEAYFSGGDCCCSPEPESLAIYDKKHLAVANQKYHTYFEVVKVEIIYALPTKVTKKK